MKKSLVLLGVFLLATPLAALAGTKEEIIRLQSDILQLQEQIRLIQKGMDENSGVLKSLLEQLNDQIAKSNMVMENLNQSLVNQKADAANVASQVKQEIQKLSLKLDDTNNRVAGVYQKLEENQVKTASMRAAPPGAEAGAGLEPDQVYNQAYNDYLMGNFDLAITGFQDFVTNYPNNEYSDNALHYLGVAFMEQGRFEQAIQAFDQVINLHPKGDKTPVAFYKKALAYQDLQKNEESIDTLRKLITLYPESQEAKLAAQELEKLGVAVQEAPPARTPAGRRRPRD